VVAYGRFEDVPEASTPPIYDQAGSYTGHPGSPPPVVSPERVARTIVGALDKPGRDLGARSVAITPATRGGGAHTTKTECMAADHQG
jgi:hypothetical protein